MPQTSLSTTLVTTISLIATHVLLAASAAQATKPVVSDDASDPSAGQIRSVTTATAPAPVNLSSNLSSSPSLTASTAAPAIKHEPTKHPIAPQSNLLTEQSELSWPTPSATTQPPASQSSRQASISHPPAAPGPATHTTAQQPTTPATPATTSPSGRPKQPTRGIAPQPTHPKKHAIAKITAKVREAAEPTAPALSTAVPEQPAAPEQPQSYFIQRGDNLHRIAKKLGTTVDALIAVNDLEDPNKIYIGAVLQLPTPEPAAPPSEAPPPPESSNPAAVHSATTPSPTTTIGPQRNASRQPQTAPTTSPANAAAPSTTTASVSLPTADLAWQNPPADTANALPPDADQPLPLTPDELPQYVWPTQGTLTSGYGWRWGRMHRGVDIAAPIGTPVIAAAAGVVESAGWNSGGYGNLVQIRHPDGSFTRYAHNQQLLVSTGEQVSQGQLIAEVGSTGHSTGPHLHFEIHQPDGSAINPLEYLAAVAPQ